MWWLSLQKPINFDNVTIISVEGNGYRIHFWYMNQDKAINVLSDANLAEKYGSL